MENVSSFVGVKFIDLFNKWQFTLEEIGYRNYARVLNAKDFGVPQSRDRIFIVSIREDLDIKYSFPQPIPLDKCILDIEEDNVDEKYFLSEERLNGLIKSTQKEKKQNRGYAFIPKLGTDIANTIQTAPTSRKTDNFILIEYNE